MTSPISILFVIGSLDVGGAERHVAMVARSLDRSRWSPAIFTLKDKGHFAAELEAEGIIVHGPIYRLAGKKGLLTRGMRLVLVSSQLFIHLMRCRPRIVHFFLPASYLLGLPLALASFCPIRVMSRRSLNCYQSKRPLLARMERILHKWTSVALGNSRAVVGQLADEGIRSERLGLIYNGIDLERICPQSTRIEVRERLGIPADALVLALVANLIPYKGHADLLAALSLARSDLPSGWRLLCIGRDDGIGEALKGDAVERGLAENILWLGERQDVADLLAASDIGLLCSHEEGFSNAVLESMAAGLPMIVTDVGGNPEAVLNGKTGLLVPPRDPHSLALALSELASDPEARCRFGVAGQQRVKEQFNLARCVADYEALYDALVTGTRPLPSNSILAADGRAKTS